MDVWAADFFQWIQGLSPFWLYLSILLIAYLENIIPPIPGDLVVVLGGYLAGIGKLNIWTVILLAAIGGTLGFMTMYALGYRLGTALLDPHRFKWLPKEKIQKALTYIRRWGYAVVAVNRFLSGLRSVISISVGIAHLHPGKVFLWSAFSATVWVTLLAWAGYLVGDNWQIVAHYLNMYGRVITLLLALILAFWIVSHWLKRKKDEKKEQN